jgi:hypothetical protein
MSSHNRSVFMNLTALSVLGTVWLAAGCTSSPKAKKANYLMAGKTLMAKQL